MTFFVQIRAPACAAPIKKRKLTPPKKLRPSEGYPPVVLVIFVQQVVHARIHGDTFEEFVTAV